MCPCPICATIALLLLPFAGYKWAKKIINKHHKNCSKCQNGEHDHMHKCGCDHCKTKTKK